MDILPRKQSYTHYTPEDDEYVAKLIIANEDFTDIKVTNIGPKEPEYGFSALRKVPGTNDLYLALKVKEVNFTTRSKICLFDLNGEMYFDPPFLTVGDEKYEGLEFL